jgi:hypothetical protein
VDVRRTIRAETTKIEAYNDFLDWVSFGGPVIKSGDPVEQDMDVLPLPLNPQPLPFELAL